LYLQEVDFHKKIMEQLAIFVGLSIPFVILIDSSADADKEIKANRIIIKLIFFNLLQPQIIWFKN